MEYCNVSGRRRRAPCAVASILTLTLESVSPFSPSWAPLVPGKSRRLIFDPVNRRILSRQRLSSTAESSSSSSSAVILPETSPLPPHTFAGQVEHALIEKFEGESAIERVLKSWRLLERDYVHKEFVGTNGKTPETSQCHQLAHSFVPGLTVHEFWDPNQFEWCQKLQSKYAAIRDEFVRVTADADALAAQGNNIWAGALTADAASYGLGWKTLVLMNRGFWDPVNVNLFPVTAQAVHQSQCPAVEVFFASMQPHTDIQTHSDFTNFVVTSHLPLVVPYSGQNKCRLTIGDTERQWINGEILMFDTSVMHEAINESDQTRYILMLRVWHPDLTETEREALQFIYSVLEFPGLLSSSEPEREKAQRQVESMRNFPALTKGMGRKTGFGAVAVTAGKPKKRKGKK